MGLIFMFSAGFSDIRLISFIQAQSRRRRHDPTLFLGHTPPTMDTLSTLREVSSNPPSPESSPSAVFPQLVISPPLSGEVHHNGDSVGDVVAAKPHNGVDPSPTEEAPGLGTPG